MTDRPQLCQEESDIPAGADCRDFTPGIMRELFYIENPQISKTDAASEQSAAAYVRSAEANPQWIWYPWLNLAVRIPGEDIYFRVRTSRNRNLITEEEQVAFRNIHIGIAGLSVGSCVLETIVATGGPKRLRIADSDTIELSNLNRMRATIHDIGANKTRVAARRVWELDPFAEIDAWDTGITKGRVNEFVEGLTVAIDEMDNIELKFALRGACRVRGIPVVMATDNGDGAILDIERFDLEKDRPIFHGRVHLTEEFRPGDREQFVRLANAIIDPKIFTPRQLASVQEIGKSLTSVAQIATGAGIAGAAVACAVRHIACGNELPSGRYTIGCESSFAM